MTPVLVLRTCASDMTAHGGFKWPESGLVSCPDWDAKPECGNGLHGLLWGQGNLELLRYDYPDRKWLIVEVDEASIVAIDNDKVKFPSGNVVFCGERDKAIAFMAERAPKDIKLPWAVSTSGYGGTSTSGYGGTSTSGDCGTSTSGDYGTSTSGDYGTSTSGDCGTSTSGYGGTSTSGDYGILQLKWWDGNRYRIATFYVGEDGIEPNVAYKLDENHKPVRA